MDASGSEHNPAVSRFTLVLVLDISDRRGDMRRSCSTLSSTEANALHSGSWTLTPRSLYENVAFGVREKSVAFANARSGADRLSHVCSRAARWQWVPTRCDLEPVEQLHSIFCKANRPIIFAGDSLTRTMWAGLAMSLNLTGAARCRACDAYDASVSVQKNPWACPSAHALKNRSQQDRAIVALTGVRQTDKRGLLMQIGCGGCNATMLFLASDYLCMRNCSGGASFPRHALREGASRVDFGKARPQVARRS